jgi:trehalose-phosphatase
MSTSPLFQDYKADSPEESHIQEFWNSLATTSTNALLLDFDGTLAPFRIDPSKVRLWSGVQDLLQRIQDAGKTRMAIITGRPARETASLIALSRPIEIWGAHGAERLHTNGWLEQESLSAEMHLALSAAINALHTAQFKGAVRLEKKWDAVAVHCRGMSSHLAQAAIERALNLLRPFSEYPGLQILQFDGGVELRAGRKKGDAVRQILSELGSNAPVAYLGDDETDEDAFHSLAERGLRVLVRRHWRPNSADIWITPPAELRNFLAHWLTAIHR